MTITDKLNEIEERTRALAGEAQTLESEKRAYEGLLECSVNDHHWSLDEQPVSNLAEVFTIFLRCKRCQCYMLYSTSNGDPNRIPLEVYMADGNTVKQLIPEEDE